MSNIEWTGRTWNPIAGCTMVSPGCTNCYAMTMAARLEAMGHQKYVGLTVKRGTRATWTGKITLVPEALGIPLKARKPTTWFVNSMSDLFHEGVPDQFVRKVFAVMSLCGQHTFQILTKRPERMAAFFADKENDLSACQAEYVASGDYSPSTTTPTGRDRVVDSRSINGTRRGPGDANYWPLPNVHLGTSVENQKTADERIPHLLRVPAAVRFLSVEPLLEAVTLPDTGKTAYCRECHGSGFQNGTADGCPACCGSGIDDVKPQIHWVIVGGESGANARPCNVEWVRSIVRQCQAAGVPVFVKQLGPLAFSDKGGKDLCSILAIKDRKGGDPAEWPEDLRVREMPEVMRRSA